MLTSFFDDPLLLEWLPMSTTVNPTAFCVTLHELRKDIKNFRRGMLSGGIIILKDNARMDVAVVYQTLLQHFSREVLKHSPYSLDLSLCECHILVYSRIEDDLQMIMSQVFLASKEEKGKDGCEIKLTATDQKNRKIELAKLQLAKLEKEVELQRAKNKALSLNPAAKVEEKQFETLNKETATHIGIREAEDWFRPIDLAKRILLWSPWKYRCGQRTVRMAVVSCSQKQNTVFARRRSKSKPKRKL
ncbi:hypothetical protein TNCV_1254141 [Trichonephila clavipes]|nr:hypothetical protein TNCV_1254141 [Trichonephila clavipes]